MNSERNNNRKTIFIGERYVVISNICGEVWESAKAISQNFLYCVGIVNNGSEYIYKLGLTKDSDQPFDFYIANQLMRYVEPVIDLNQLIAFDLEVALKEPDRVIYRNGNKPLQWHYFDKSPHRYSITSVTPENSYNHLTNGAFIDSKISDSDLMLTPLPKCQYQINIYMDKDRVMIKGEIYPVNSGKHWPEVKMMAAKKLLLIEELKFTF